PYMDPPQKSPAQSSSRSTLRALRAAVPRILAEQRVDIDLRLRDRQQNTEVLGRGVVAVDRGFRPRRVLAVPDEVRAPLALTRHFEQALLQNRGTVERGARVGRAEHPGTQRVDEPQRRRVWRRLLVQRLGLDQIDLA